MKNAIDVRTIPKILYSRYARQSNVVQEEVNTILYFGDGGINEAVYTKILISTDEGDKALYLTLVLDHNRAHFMIFEELPLQEEKTPLLQIRTNVRKIPFQGNEGYLFDVMSIVDPLSLLNPFGTFVHGVSMAAFACQRNGRYKNFFINPDVPVDVIMKVCQCHL